ncbi:MAG: LPXTG cell wall anchor domain-containing protein [Actinobacteria bacterium]|nr:LPXTG cell wall anchor domain-containing protein [Actinomycetota bacterium]
MKAKTDKKHVMFAILALLTTMVVLLLAAVPAMAGPVHLNRDAARGFVGVDSHTPGHILDQIESLDGSPATPIPEGVDPHLAFSQNRIFYGPSSLVLDHIVPGDEADDADEEVDETDEAEETTETDEAEEVDEADDSDEVEEDESEEAMEDEEDENDEVTEEENENDEVTEEEAGEEDDGDEPTLPYTGGDSTPWLIAGAAVILAGALMVTRRRNGDSRR